MDLYSTKPLRGRSGTAFTVEDLTSMGFSVPIVLERGNLMEKLVENSMENGVLLIHAPAGTGKTIALKKLKSYPGLKCVYFSCCKAISQTGITRALDQDATGMCILSLDDGQFIYQDTALLNFLVGLPKDKKYANRLRIVIAATHTLSFSPEFPEALNGCRLMNRESFILDSVEAEQLMLSVLPQELSKKPLMNMLAHQCGGVAGALLVSASILAEEFPKAKYSEQKSQIQSLFMSGHVLERFNALFKSQDGRNITDRVRDILVKGFSSLSKDMLSISEEDLAYLTTVGATNDDGEFSSPLMQRCLFKVSFSNRSLNTPEDLLTLMQITLVAIPLSVLQNSRKKKGQLPNEATFQHVIMGLLAGNTSNTCHIIPELWSSMGLRIGDKKGKIDFFINDCWGLELLVGGDPQKIEEHCFRFGPQGKYAALEASEYYVVCFRLKSERFPIIRKDKLITVSFSDDLSNAEVYIGKRTPYTITLKG